MSEAVALLCFLTVQRMAELIWAHHNTERLRAAGGTEHGRAQYPLLIALHATWLGGLWIIGHDRPVDLPMLSAFVVLQCGRLWVLATLGRRWTTRIIVVPGAPLISSGPYRLIRHPNYLIVAGEIAVVPLALGLPIYAAAFALANALLLWKRIQVENAALACVRFPAASGRNTTS
jgi:methyltransferase